MIRSRLQTRSRVWGGKAETVNASQSSDGEFILGVLSSRVIRLARSGYTGLKAKQSLRIIVLRSDRLILRG